MKNRLPNLSMDCNQTIGDCSVPARMNGYVHAAGIGANQRRSDVAAIAEYFSIPPVRLGSALDFIEASDRPEILLLQNTSSIASVWASAFMPSLWSVSYAKVGNPYGCVHRDFHYQVLFSAMAVLLEVGCEGMRIENPMPLSPWRRDAYICLREAQWNLARYTNSNPRVLLLEGSYDKRMVAGMDIRRPEYVVRNHRPIGIHLHIFAGMNMRTVFVEKRTTDV